MNGLGQPNDYNSTSNLGNNYYEDLNLGTKTTEDVNIITDNKVRMTIDDITGDVHVFGNLTADGGITGATASHLISGNTEGKDLILGTLDDFDIEVQRNGVEQLTFYDDHIGVNQQLKGEGIVPFQWDSTHVTAIPTASLDAANFEVTYSADTAGDDFVGITPFMTIGTHVQTIIGVVKSNTNSNDYVGIGRNLVGGSNDHTNFTDYFIFRADGSTVTSVSLNTKLATYDDIGTRTWTSANSHTFTMAFYEDGTPDDLKHYIMFSRTGRSIYRLDVTGLTASGWQLIHGNATQGSGVLTTVKSGISADVIIDGYDVALEISRLIQSSSIATTSGAIEAISLDASSAITLPIGPVNATKIELADTTIVTESKGPLHGLEGLDITGDIVVSGLVDGVDIAEFKSLYNDLVSEVVVNGTPLNPQAKTVTTTGAVYQRMHLDVGASRIFVLAGSNLESYSYDAFLAFTLLDTLVLTGTLAQITVTGTTAYISAGAEFHTVDISDPSNLALHVSTSARTYYESCVVGSNLYIAANTTGIDRYDISTPSAPSYLDSYDDGANARRCTVYDSNTKLLVGTVDGVYGVDISTPGSESTLFAEIAMSGTVNKINVDEPNDTFYSGTSDGNLYAHVLSTQALISNIDIGPSAREMVHETVDGRQLLYIANSGSGLQTVELAGGALSIIASDDQGGTYYGVASDIANLHLFIGTSAGLRGYEAESVIEVNKMCVMSPDDTTGAGTGAYQMAGGMYVTKNIYSGGSLVVASNISSTSGTIGGLTAAELAELGNIDSTTISNTQWGYLGALDQNLTTTSAVDFAQLTVDFIQINGGSLTYSNTSGNNRIVIPDNQAIAFAIREGTTNYLSLDTTDGAEKIKLNKCIEVDCDVDDTGITLQVSDNTFSNGLMFKNSGGSFTGRMFREDTGGNQADIVFSCDAANSDVSLLTESMRIKNDDQTVEITSGLLEFTQTGANANKILIPDNLAAAFTITEGANPYIDIITSNASENILFHKVLTLNSGLNLTAGGHIKANDIRGVSAAAMNIAGTTSTKLNLAVTGVTTEVKGPLDVIELLSADSIEATDLILDSASDQIQIGSAAKTTLSSTTDVTAARTITMPNFNGIMQVWGTFTSIIDSATQTQLNSLFNVFLVDSTTNANDLKLFDLGAVSVTHDFWVKVIDVGNNAATNNITFAVFSGSDTINSTLTINTNSGSRLIYVDESTRTWYNAGN